MGRSSTAASEDYEESDVTDPQRMHDFRLIYDRTVPGDDNAAQVRVEYVRAHRAELQIRPAPGRGKWKSPDIDVKGPGGAIACRRGCGTRSWCGSRTPARSARKTCALG